MSRSLACLPYLFVSLLLFFVHVFPFLCRPACRKLGLIGRLTPGYE